MERHGMRTFLFFGQQFKTFIDTLGSCFKCFLQFQIKNNIYCVIHTCHSKNISFFAFSSM